MIKFRRKGSALALSLLLKPEKDLNSIRIVRAKSLDALVWAIVRVR